MQNQYFYFHIRFIKHFPSCLCSCWTSVTSRRWRKLKPLEVHTWQLLASLRTDRSVLRRILLTVYFRDEALRRKLCVCVFRSVRTTGTTSVSWSCSLWPCRKLSNTSTLTQGTTFSSESVRNKYCYLLVSSSIFK